MKISIITVTLNSDQTLRDTLNSVFSQTYKNIEHIIIDGGSKDQTLPLSTTITLDMITDPDKNK